MTIFFKNLGVHGPLPPGYAYASDNISWNWPELHFIF